MPSPKQCTLSPARRYQYQPLKYLKQLLLKS